MKSLLLFTTLICASQFAPPANGDALPPVRKSQTELTTIRYAKDIAPLFARSCAGCHNARNSASGYDISNYEAMMRGGNKGAAIIPGKSEKSLLYKYIIGKTKPSMPLGGVVAAIEISHVKQWIDAGAKNELISNAELSKGVGFGAISAQVAPPVTALAFSPDKETLLVGTYQQVQLWDLKTGKRTGILKGASKLLFAYL